MLPRIKCLLVEHLDENLQALSAVLEGDDVEILSARSGPEALELLLIHDFALAFLDVQIPEMDGFQLAARMRGSERARHIPIIFVTAGVPEPQHLFEGYEAGAVDFIHQPIEPHILQKKAGVFFELYRQRQQLSQQLAERTETLRLNEMWSALLAHDLRNPLSAILASAELLRRRTQDRHAQQAAARIQSSGNHMRRLIEDMFDLARARLAGGIVIKREAANLDALVARVVHEHRPAAPHRVIETEYTGSSAGQWDAERMAQVASNLIDNALKYGNEDGPVQVCVDGTSEFEVVLTVSNSGTIAADRLAHLFDPFGGAERPPGRSEGLGLGLYIVQQIVAAHGGTVSVTGGDRGRTTLRVAVPRAA
jgi:signal transduction histidine kinase